MTTHVGSSKYYSIAPDKREFPRNIFLISLRNCFLWVLIRSVSVGTYWKCNILSPLNKYQQHMLSWTNKKKISAGFFFYFLFI